MKISGVILDIDSVPLSGANITLKSGSKSGKIGTVTDFDGKFTLDSNDFSESDVFEVSYIGFLKQNFTAKELQEKKITLKESATELDEIVLIGNKPKSNGTNNLKNNVLKEHLEKNKYVYASASGLLGLALLLVSIKKLK